jgi:catechol 2,3-dioxygenase-like lactoylglutathione lyase family enzyme
MITRMENVGIVVEDLQGAIEFFTELGLELEGQATVDQDWAARVCGFDEVRCDIAMLRTPDGNGHVELMSYRTPTAVRTGPVNAPANTLGLHRVLFAVDDIEGVVEGLRSRGVELLGELTRIEDSYLFCYVRGPEGIIVAFAEKLG